VQTRLQQSEPYVAGEGRTQQLTNNYGKLKLQMSVTEVEKNLGKADFATGTPPARLATGPEPADKGAAWKPRTSLRRTART